MQYVKPQVDSTMKATSTIQGKTDKQTPLTEGGMPTINSAYEADE